MNWLNNVTSRKRTRTNGLPSYMYGFKVTSRSLDLFIYFDWERILESRNFYSIKESDSITSPTLQINLLSYRNLIWSLLFTVEPAIEIYEKSPLENLSNFDFYL